MIDGCLCGRIFTTAVTQAVLEALAVVPVLPVTAMTACSFSRLEGAVGFLVTSELSRGEMGLFIRCCERRVYLSLWLQNVRGGVEASGWSRTLRDLVFSHKAERANLQ